MSLDANMQDLTREVQENTRALRDLVSALQKGGGGSPGVGDGSGGRGVGSGGGGGSGGGSFWQSQQQAAVASASSAQGNAMSAMRSFLSQGLGGVSGAAGLSSAFSGGVSGLAAAAGGAASQALQSRFNPSEAAFEARSASLASGNPNYDESFLTQRANIEGAIARTQKAAEERTKELTSWRTAFSMSGKDAAQELIQVRSAAERRERGLRGELQGLDSEEQNLERRLERFFAPFDRAGVKVSQGDLQKVADAFRPMAENSAQLHSDLQYVASKTIASSPGRARQNANK